MIDVNFKQIFQPQGVPMNNSILPLFSDIDDFCPDYLRKEVLYPALKKAGIERVDRTHGFHLFRHSAGSIIHAQTGDLKLAQE
jgi:hypothetical protein